jgi:hypothetical protein
VAVVAAQVDIHLVLVAPGVVMVAVLHHHLQPQELQIQAAEAVAVGFKLPALLAALASSSFAGLNHNNHPLPQQEALR